MNDALLWLGRLFGVIGALVCALALAVRLVGQFQVRRVRDRNAVSRGYGGDGGGVPVPAAADGFALLAVAPATCFAGYQFHSVPSSRRLIGSALGLYG